MKNKIFAVLVMLGMTTPSFGSDHAFQNEEQWTLWGTIFYYLSPSENPSKLTIIPPPPSLERKVSTPKEVLRKQVKDLKKLAQEQQVTIGFLEQQTKQHEENPEGRSIRRSHTSFNDILWKETPPSSPVKH